MTRKKLGKRALEKMRRKQGNRCHYCGRQMRKRGAGSARGAKGFGPTKDSATVDHVEALTNGGLDHKRNRVLACRGCNERKGAMGANEFRRMIAVERERWGQGHDG